MNFVGVDLKALKKPSKRTKELLLPYLKKSGASALVCGFNGWNDVYSVLGSTLKSFCSHMKNYVSNVYVSQNFPSYPRTRS